MVPPLVKGKDAKIEFLALHDIYYSLSPPFQMIIKVLALIHDIGIVDGLQNHGPDGVKYIPLVLKELNLNDQFWNEYGLNLNDAIIILGILTRYHTLINKISAEDSDNCIKMKCRDIQNSLRNTSTRISCCDIASCLMLLGVADLIAVDDKLYSSKKYTLIMESYSFMKLLFEGNKPNRNHEKIALCRLGEMVYDNEYVDIKNDVINVLRMIDFSYETFCEGLYYIYQIDYATSYLKPLRNFKSTVMVLCGVLQYLLRSFIFDIIKKTILRFDSALDYHCFEKAINDNEFIPLLRKMNRIDRFSESKNIRIIHDLYTNELVISNVKET